MTTPQAILREALEDIREMTDADNPESYRSDDREGCLDTVFAVADDALAAVAQMEQQAAQEPSGALTATLAEAIRYPACWDTAAYPSLEDALLEFASTTFRCGECGQPPSEAATWNVAIEAAAAVAESYKDYHGAYKGPFYDAKLYHQAHTNAGDNIANRIRSLLRPAAQEAAREQPAKCCRKTVIDRCKDCPYAERPAKGGK